MHSAVSLYVVVINLKSNESSIMNLSAGFSTLCMAGVYPLGLSFLKYQGSYQCLLVLVGIFVSTWRCLSNLVIQEGLE